MATLFAAPTLRALWDDEVLHAVRSESEFYFPVDVCCFEHKVCSRPAAEAEKENQAIARRDGESQSIRACVPPPMGWLLCREYNRDRVCGH
jgi:hypothetical protein